MLAWTIAAVAGLVWAAVSYLPAARPARILLPAALRALAVALLVALALDAAAGRAAQRSPLVALDVSASWTRGSRHTAWQRAVRLAGSLRTDSLLLFGDSVRAGTPPAVPGDARSDVRTLAERALAAGRPLVVVTDGILDNAPSLDALPSGSRIELVAGADRPDAALVALDAPRAVVAGDSITARLTVSASGTGARDVRVGFALDDRPLGTMTLDAVPAHGERVVVFRALVPAGAEHRVLRAAIAAGDDEPRNDTLTLAIETTPAAGAVFVSTSPDFDSREALAVLRGALAISTRGYLRVAPGQWRVDGTLAPVGEAEVRRAAMAAPLLVIHGDTAVFGPPRSATRGSLALVVPSRERGGEYFVTGAPPSPVAAALSGIAWDSLPPLDVVPALPEGDWTALESRRARRFERRAVIVGQERPRRVVIIGASGFWRWRFRGGSSADAFASVWGSVLDWLAAERPDVRTALPTGDLLRAGEPVRWRRGGTDSIVTVRLARQGAQDVEPLRLRFTGGQSVVESAPLPPGVYEAHTSGGSSLLVVNASRELLPAVPTVRGGAIGSGAAAPDERRARTLGLLFAAAIVLLCAEWILRRHAGLR